MNRSATISMLLTSALIASAPAWAANVQVATVDGVGKPLVGAVVFLESREARAATRPAREVSIAQVDRQFSPRVTVIPVGTAVSFPNRDKVRHHVYSFSPVKTFELKLYAGTPANPVVFDKVGIAVLGCNIHDNMSAWVVVVETPYFAQTDTTGRATLEGVPPGQYRLRTWHAGLAVGAPASDEPVSVAANGSSFTQHLKGVTP